MPWVELNLESAAILDMQRVQLLQGEMTNTVVPWVLEWEVLSKICVYKLEQMCARSVNTCRSPKQLGKQLELLKQYIFATWELLYVNVYQV